MKRLAVNCASLKLGGKPAGPVALIVLRLRGKGLRRQVKSRQSMQCTEKSTYLIP